MRPIHLSENVIRLTDVYWQYLFRRNKPGYDISGKYLFFSEDRHRLVRIAVEEIENNGFHAAKVNMKGQNYGPEYVLCLYYEDDSRKKELAEKYSGVAGIRYRYWKSDQDTREGKYSEQFLSQLSDGQK